jgi:hypothetical protein
MRKVNEFFVGWIDTSIGTLIQTDITVFSRFAFLMIASIDSSKDMVGIATGYRIIERYNGCSMFAGSLLVPGGQIEQISCTFNLFNGFDEVWCFDEAPKFAKPTDLWIVSPLNVGQEDVPRLLVPWMRESGCRLGLGDGIGLNYATPDESTAHRLELGTGN